MPTLNFKTQFTRLAPWLVLLPALMAYLPTIIARPLLDEQFLLNWLSFQNQSNVSNYFSFAGFDQKDMWGPITLGFFKIISSGNIYVIAKVANLVIHLLNTLCVFVLVYYLFNSFLIALSAEIIFSLYPLNAEAIAWLGGESAVLSTFFFLISLICYLKARNQLPWLTDNVVQSSPYKIQWQWLLIALLALALATSSNVLICINVLIFPLFELTRFLHARGKITKENFLLSLAVSMLMIFIPALIIICGISSSTFSLKTLYPHLKANYLVQFFKHLFLPINEFNWHGYAKEYRYAYVLLFLPFIPMCYVLFKRKDIQCLFCFALLATLLAVFPYLGYALISNNLYGERWLYFAIFPFSILLAILFTSIHFAGFRFQKAANIAFISLFLLANIFYFRHLFNETSAERVAGKVLFNIQKSLKIVAGKEDAPYLFIRNIPEFVAHANSFVPKDMICLSTHDQNNYSSDACGLLAAKSIPDGRLQKALQEEKYSNIVLRWDKDFQSLLPVDSSLKASLYPDFVNAEEMQRFFVPGFVFYKNATYDTTEKCIRIETNSALGPVISLNAEGLSPVTGDLLYLDVRIDTADKANAAPVEFYWQTRFCSDYDNKERKLIVQAQTNDKQFHRLYFPLRSLGWSTNGAPILMTIGFPASARVSIQSMGLAKAEKVIPEFTSQPEMLETNKVATFDCPYFNYPNIKELELISLPKEAQSMVFAHNVQNIEGATGIVVEISNPDYTFNNPNGNILSKVTGRTIPLKGISGKYKIPFTDFPSKGVYSFRIIAINNNGDFIGNFSDAISVLIRK